MTRLPDDTAIVLSGGGARAAYQIGVLRAITRMLGRRSVTPFRIICGTSAGAVIAALLAADADNFRRGLARLLRLWRNIEVGHVYKADLATVSSHGMRWLTSVLIGSRGPSRTASMLDSSPLRSLLLRELDPGRIGMQIAGGHLRALAINATSYTTGHSVSFFQGEPAIRPWERIRRRGQRASIGIDHLLASSAIPFIFRRHVSATTSMPTARCGRSLHFHRRYTWARAECLSSPSVSSSGSSRLPVTHNNSHVTHRSPKSRATRFPASFSITSARTSSACSASIASSTSFRATYSKPTRTTFMSTRLS